MKSTIKMLMLVVAITFSTVLSASTNELPTEDPKTLTEKIHDLLENPSFIAEEEMEANVTLMLNKNCELVVLSIDSDSEVVKSYIKSRLNYKKMEADVNEINKTFVVHVKIELEK